MSPEVLIYIKNIKKFLDNNNEARQYFLNCEINEDDFYSKVAELSQKNFDKNGNPLLYKNQFEKIKNELLNSLDEKKDNNIFFDLKDLGTICLN